MYASAVRGRDGPPPPLRLSHLTAPLSWGVASDAAGGRRATGVRRGPAAPTQWVSEADSYNCAAVCRGAIRREDSAARLARARHAPHVPLTGVVCFSVKKLYDS